MAVNASSPDDAAVAARPSAVPEVAFSFAVVAGLIALFYLVYFVFARRVSVRGEAETFLSGKTTPPKTG